MICRIDIGKKVCCITQQSIQRYLFFFQYICNNLFFYQGNSTGELVKRILALKSSAIVMVHNHPSGCVEPSAEDKAITTKMEDFDDFDCDEDDFLGNDSDGEFCYDRLNDEMQEDSEQEDNGIDIGWEEIAIIGGMVEEFSEEEKERRRIKRKMNKDKDRNNF